MKRILIGFLLIAFFSCKEKKSTSQESENIQSDSSEKAFNSYGVPDSLLIKDSYLVFLNKERFPSALSLSNSSLLSDSLAVKELEQKISNQILEFAKNKNLKVNPDHILVSSQTGFVLENISQIQLKDLLIDNDIGLIQQNFRLGMENSRARMQTDVLLQNSRARMQENPRWGYDVTNFTAKAITYLAGTNRKTKNKAKIWIVDSGIDASHQDFNKNQVNRNLSRSFVLSNSNIFDTNPFFDFWGHGTHCAGLAAADSKNRGKNMIGMNGVSPGAELVSLKVFGMEGYAEFAWIVEALEYASQRNRLKSGDIISLSLGAQVGYCKGQEGIIHQMQSIANMLQVKIVVAAGNGYKGPGESATLFSPACVEGAGIYTVASVDLDYESTTQLVSFSDFSNYGVPPIDWAVPGNNIFSTYPSNSYAVMEGTSMSAALMSGLLHLTGGNLREKARVTDSRNYTYPIPEK